MEGRRDTASVCQDILENTARKVSGGNDHDQCLLVVQAQIH